MEGELRINVVIGLLHLAITDHLEIEALILILLSPNGSSANWGKLLQSVKTIYIFYAERVKKEK